MGLTTFLGLVTTSSSAGSSVGVLQSRLDQYGDTNSNMTKIDSFASDISGSFNAFTIGDFPMGTANLVTTNSYSATLVGVTSYTSLVCMMTFVQTNSGSSLVNINGLGVKSIYKTQNGVQKYLAGGELVAGEYYLFYYDGNAMIMVNGYASSNAKYITSASNLDLPNSLVITAGSGITITTGSSGSATLLYINNSITVGDNCTTTTGSLLLTSSHTHINVDATSGGVTIYTPSPAGFLKTYSVKKIDSTANVVTISGSPSIDGASTATLTTQYASKTFYSNGTNAWFIQ